MATSVVAREYRGETLYLRGSEVPAYSWTADRSEAKRFTNADGWRLAREYNKTAWAADGEAFVIDATGSVGKAATAAHGVAEAPAPHAPDCFKGRLSAWMAKHLDGHNISDHVKLSDAFVAEFHVAPEWPHYSREDMARMIGSRGKGGSLGGGKDSRYAPDYRIAEHYARTLAAFEPWQSGLGFRFRSALEALEKAGY